MGGTQRAPVAVGSHLPVMTQKTASHLVPSAEQVSSPFPLLSQRWAPEEQTAHFPSTQATGFPAGSVPHGVATHASPRSLQVSTAPSPQRRSPARQAAQKYPSGPSAHHPPTAQAWTFTQAPDRHSWTPSTVVGAGRQRRAPAVHSVPASTPGSGFGTHRPVTPSQRSFAPQLVALHAHSGGSP